MFETAPKGITVYRLSDHDPCYAPFVGSSNCRFGSVGGYGSSYALFRIGGFSYLSFTERTPIIE